ncbi:hypothetical protein J2X35_002566 [Mesorhizobium sp. BE184]|nr:hypothetical protein [Mesorhizobium sp. BE184]
MGSGNRVVAKGGRHSKYHITVPEEMLTLPAHTTDKSPPDSRSSARSGGEGFRFKRRNRYQSFHKRSDAAVCRHRSHVLYLPMDDRDEALKKNCRSTVSDSRCDHQGDSRHRDHPIL